MSVGAQSDGDGISPVMRVGISTFADIGGFVVQSPLDPVATAPGTDTDPRPTNLSRDVMPLELSLTYIRNTNR